MDQESLGVIEMVWLSYCTKNRGSRYPGELREKMPYSLIPKLKALGLVEEFVPHNPVHKPRLVATDKGQQMIDEFNKPKKRSD